MPAPSRRRAPSSSASPSHASAKSADLDVLADESWQAASAAHAIIGVGGDLVVGDLFLERALALAHQRPGAVVERVEAATSGGSEVLAALRTPGLFGARVALCRDLHEIDRSLWPALSDALGDGDAALVGHASTLVVAARRALGSQAAIFDCRTPKSRSLAAVVDTLAEREGIALGGDQRRLLLTVAGADLPRVRSVLRQCAAAGLRAPSAKQLHVLAGSRAGGAGAGPWELAGAIERGDVGAALAWLDESRDDPFATLGYLRSRLGRDAASWAAISAAELGLRSAADRAAVLDLLVMRLCESSAAPTAASGSGQRHGFTGARR